MYRTHFSVLCFFLLGSFGCSGQVAVKGVVSFEDGTPLTDGTVVFEKDNNFQAVGRIRPDGSYTLGSYKINDGVPLGKYSVYITGAVSVIEKKLDNIKDGKGLTSIPVFTKLIDVKYESPETSGLRCEVKKDTKYDIKVEPPRKK